MITTILETHALFNSHYSCEDCHAYGELPTAPNTWFFISVTRICVAIPSAALVEDILTNRNSYVN